MNVRHESMHRLEHHNFILADARFMMKCVCVYTVVVVVSAFMYVLMRPF